MRRSWRYCRMCRSTGGHWGRCARVGGYWGGAGRRGAAVSWPGGGHDRGVLRLGGSADAGGGGPLDPELRLHQRVRTVIVCGWSRTGRSRKRSAGLWRCSRCQGTRGWRRYAQPGPWMRSGTRREIRSADFCWYTKRAILAAIYGATVLFWLRDSSEDDAATLAFLDRRLAGVGRITSVRRRVEAMAGQRLRLWTPSKA